VGEARLDRSDHARITDAVRWALQERAYGFQHPGDRIIQELEAVGYTIVRHQVVDSQEEPVAGRPAEKPRVIKRLTAAQLRVLVHVAELTQVATSNLDKNQQAHAKRLVGYGYLRQDADTTYLTEAGKHRLYNPEKLL